jgi:uncharacterized protein
MGDSQLIWESILSLPSGKPPNECEGYPYPMIPRDIPLESQCSFYLPKTHHPHGEALACSLYRSMMPRKSNAVDEAGFHGVPVIIICHGYMSWRNQMLLAHLAAGLTKRLNCHTLRFDFTGNGHSTGVFRHSNYDGEFYDLQAVISFVEQNMACRVVCVIGHSKGAASVLRTAAEQDKCGDAPTPRKIACFVNISGRFSVPHEYNVEKLLGVEKAREFRQTGKVVLSNKGARECVMTMDDVEERSNLDSSFVRSIRHSHILTLHGSMDERVEVSNAIEFAKNIRNHELFIVEGADHNYNGLLHMPIMVATIAEFVDKHMISVQRPNPS